MKKTKFENIYYIEKLNNLKSKIYNNQSFIINNLKNKKLI